MSRHAMLLLLAFFIAGPASAQWAPCGRDLTREAWQQWGPRAVTNGAGGAIVVWQDARNLEDPLAYPDIYARAITSTGAPLGALGGTPICTAPRPQDNPDLASDGSGGAIMVWVDARNEPDGVSRHDIYAQRVNSSGGALWVVDGYAVCAAPGSQSWPQVISDGSGGAIIAWSDFRNGMNWDIYVQRINAAGTPLWTTNGVALCTADFDQLYPQLTSDGAGGAIVTWTDGRGAATGTGSDLYVRRISSSGTPLWTANGVPLCTTFGDQWAPELVSDGSGGAYVTWHDNRVGILDIYAQRVDAAGVPLWTSHGKLYALRGSYPQIVTDGSGGAIFAWAGNGGVFAQRVDGTGFPFWVSSGAKISSLNAGALQMIADGLGGAIVTWHTFASGTAYDIVAQSVNAAGVPGPSSDGVSICNGPANQHYPAIAPSGSGAAIVAWVDERDYDATGEDIYAMWTAPGGTPAGVTVTPEELAAPDAPRSLTLARPYPSPSDGRTTFRIGLPHGGLANLRIYDASGRRISNILEGSHPAGWLVHTWNGRDDSGHPVASGIYFAALEANGVAVRRKLVVTR